MAQSNKRDLVIDQYRRHPSLTDPAPNGRETSVVTALRAQLAAKDNTAPGTHSPVEAIIRDPETRTGAAVSLDPELLWDSLRSVQDGV
jgi:hypothetical protein